MIAITDTQQREAARQFFYKWNGKGQEDEHARSYWIDILQAILGMDRVTDRVDFEKKDDVSFVRVHHSRVLRFIGRELPYMEMQRESFWGASELEHIWDELQKRSATSANIAQLVFQANITTLKMSDFGESLANGIYFGREGHSARRNKATVSEFLGHHHAG